MMTQFDANFHELQVSGAVSTGIYSHGILGMAREKGNQRNAGWNIRVKYLIYIDIFSYFLK